MPTASWTESCAGLVTAASLHPSPSSKGGQDRQVQAHRDGSEHCEEQQQRCVPAACLRYAGRRRVSIGRTRADLVACSAMESQFGDGLTCRMMMTHSH